jgi:hypothetical protein
MYNTYKKGGREGDRRGYTNVGIIPVLPVPPLTRESRDIGTYKRDNGIFFLAFLLNLIS